MVWKVLAKKSLIAGLALVSMVPGAAHAYGEPDVIRGYVNKQGGTPLIKPSWGNFIIHTEPLNKLYNTRGYAAIWVNSDGRPNQLAMSLKSYLAQAERHGLVSSDYWDSEVESLYAAAMSNQKNWITFELAVSEAVIRYVSHLSTGRFEPELIDSDIKFKKKEFNEFAELNSVLSSGVAALPGGLERFAPQNYRYADLMQVLANLRAQKAQGGWPTLTSPGFALKLGVKTPVVAQLRTRLNQLGYTVSEAGGSTFDQEFDSVIRSFQEKNGLKVDGIIGVRSEVLRVLNYTVNQRIAQVEVTMEKLRWLPRSLETRHIFINLATTEFKLFDEQEKVFDFKTVNGQAFRRTPSMRDLITFVDLNPTWTVPHSIAVRDKIDVIRKNPNYLAEHDMQLLDPATQQPVDPYSVDWSQISTKNFPYLIRQNPGMHNALGVVKFPLQNPWAIYLHDTNERNLFQENKRHRSSGCIRLEQPLELAAYLLQGQSGWSLDEIKAFVPYERGQSPIETSRKVTLKKAMPVYLMYLTVEKLEGGAIRFVDDVYGQDMRVGKALVNRKNGSELF